MHKKEYWKHFGTLPLVVLLEGDITQQHTDAIVNATTKNFEMAGGVDTAITQAAGPGMKEECKQYGGLETAQVIITKGYNLPAPYIIHTVGPVFGKADGQETQLLTACYRNCLWLADQYQLTSITFPCISTGISGYPVDKASQVMARAIGGYFFDPQFAGSTIKEVRCIFYTAEKCAIAEPIFDETYNRNDA